VTLQTSSEKRIRFLNAAARLFLRVPVAVLPGVPFSLSSPRPPRYVSSMPKPQASKAPRKRGRPPGPDYGLAPSLRRRLRRHRAADAAREAAAKEAEAADLRARLDVVCTALVVTGCRLSEALALAGLTWPRLHAFLRRDPEAADFYRTSLSVRDSERPSPNRRFLLKETSRKRRN